MHSQDRDELDELGESKSDQHHKPTRQRRGRRGRREQVREGGVSSDREFVWHSEYIRESLEGCAEDWQAPCSKSSCWVRYRENVLWGKRESRLLNQMVVAWAGVLLVGMERGTLIWVLF